MTAAAVVRGHGRECFAPQLADGSLVVVLDPDIAEVFTTLESVKKVLRALIETMPKPT